MGERIIKIKVLYCERCNHEWVPHNMAQKPKVCPKCKSPYWDIPRRKRTKN